MPRTRIIAGTGIAAVAAAALVAATASGSLAARPVSAATVASNASTVTTATPIKHVVVIFDENVSYDHYFGTYPNAANTDGTAFHAASNTPANNNLVTSGNLLHNPNLYAPRRLSPQQAMTCDQNHNYGPEQSAFDNGAMDAFVQNVSVDSCTGEFGQGGLAMDFYDGNTVTALWNYAQHYAMSDNSFGSTFGPSTPGALNLVSGQTHGFIEVDPTTGKQVVTPGGYVLASPDAQGVGTVINDPDPAYDDCSDSNRGSSNTLAQAVPGQKNVGDLLNAKGVTWGWFQGGFAPSTPASNTQKYAVCGVAHLNENGATVNDYSPHHNPFQYYASTANPHHLAPSSVQAIGTTDRANHEYDLSDFDASLASGNLPSVSFLKAAEYQDGHAGYSDPIDEQHFLVKEINEIEHSSFWPSTAIVIAYDDSDGWYDHVAATITNSSHDSANDKAICNGSSAPEAGGYSDRCGPGPRLPLLVISPYAKTNFVAHSVSTQSSILKMIEQNWGLGHIGDGSFDATAGSLNNMFTTTANTSRLYLNPDGSVMTASQQAAYKKSLAARQAKDLSAVKAQIAAN